MKTKNEMNDILKNFKDIFDNLKAIGQVFSYIWFIVLPVAFYYLFKVIWLDYRQCVYANSIPYVLLEIIPPRDIEKSPKPMESIYSGIAGVHTTLDVLEVFAKGMLTDKFSLELVSVDGVVHFYVRAPVKFRNLFEAHLYAQYPDVEITEAEDYVDKVPKLIPNKNWDLWGCDFDFGKPDPYPIKTYKYFQEDITGKMIDPLAGLVETMGTLGPGQQIWFQIIIVPEKEVDWHKKNRKYVDEFAGRIKKRKGFTADLGSDLGDIFSSILPALFGPVEFGAKAEEKEEAPLEFRLTPVEKEVLKALESNVGKNMYRTKMRFIYLGKKEVFSKAFVSSFVGGIKQFNDLNLNSFKPHTNSKTESKFVFKKPRKRFRQRKIFRRYKERDMDGKKIFLSTEELATVYHLPDMSVVAPSITRVEAKRGGAPANLPVA